jgi:hypothetical protein
MADDDQVFLRGTESNEEIESRSEFLDDLNISDGELGFALEQANQHALIGPPGRPALGAPPAHTWYPIGPRNVGGRIRALAQDPTDARVLYAGSSLGGVFRTRDAGDTWECLAEVGSAPHLNQHNYPVGALAIPEQKPDTLYIGTGDPIIAPGGGAFGSGRGLWVARIRPDRLGVQFDRLAAPPAPGTAPNAAANGASFRYTCICVDPDDPDQFWAGGTTGLWQFKVTFPIGAPPIVVPQRVFPQNPLAGTIALPAAEAPFVTDLCVSRDPAAPAQRLLLFAGLSGAGVFRGVFTRGAGIVWNLVLGPATAPALPAGFGRVKVAQCKGNANHVYAIVETAPGAPGNVYPSVVFHSTDAGVHWTAPPVATGLMPPAFGNATGIAWYSMVLAIHPDRPNVVVAGSIDLWISEDFGVDWRKLLAWENDDAGDRAQHSDQHAAIFDIEDSKKLWVANDGGISLAPDIRAPGVVRGFWRKRSHGILAAQFQDITAHPTIQQMCGGGLQDNGTFLGYGGPTWYHIRGGDGGMTAYDPANPRNIFTTTQVAIRRARIIAPPAPANSLTLNSPVLNEILPPPANFTVFAQATGAFPAANTPPFIGVIEHHPIAAQTLLVGRVLGAFFSTNGGAAWTAAPGVAGLVAGEFVKSVAFSPTGAGAQRAGWAGTSRGQVFRSPNAPGAAFALVNNPAAAAVWPPLASPINRIAVHPTNPAIVAVATGLAPGGTQGRVMITYNSAATPPTWLDVSGVPAAGPTPTSLPPGPVTSLAFDPANPVPVLYAGTLAGIYVLLNLPAFAAPPVAGFAPNWRPFNTGLPLILVNDLAFLGAGANRTLRAATFGRGMYDCRVQAPIQRQLYIRQTVIEDGFTYPRVPLANLPIPDDPRVPVGTVRLDYAHAFDIRIDAPPLASLEGTVDGVEFDEDIGAGPLIPGQLNYVFVQVLNAGSESIRNVTVHLYFHDNVPAVAFGGAIPDAALGNPADIWHAGFDPVGGSRWARVRPPVVLAEVGPAKPAVARFEWKPDSSLQNQTISLFALCSGPAGVDDLPAVMPPAFVNFTALITGERRAALRIAAVGPFNAATSNVFIRHGAEDEGSPGGVSLGTRSPDIIVVQADPANPFEDFKDILSPRSDDFVKGTGVNSIYVRIFNRGIGPVNVDVDLFWAKPNVPLDAAEAHAPPFDNTKWSAVAPVGSVTNMIIPSSRFGLVKIPWNNPATDVGASNLHKSILLIALVKSTDNQDPEPVRTRVTGLREFAEFFALLSDSENAAMRALKYQP